MWTRYLLTLVATSFVLLAAYSGALAVLYQTGHLPPPPIVNDVCADEKLEWMRDNPPKNPNLLIVGSSLAWRNIDSEQFVLQRSSARPLNGGLCHMQVNQAGFIAEYLLKHFPSIRTVVVVVGPMDLVDCSQVPIPPFDPQSADGYVFERRWAYPFYLSHFDLVSLVRNASVIRAARAARHSATAIMNTRYGDGPADVTGTHGLGIAGLKRYDSSCFASLHSVAKTVTSSGRNLVVAASPMNPAWLALFDPEGRRQDELDADVRSALHDTGAKFWDGASAFAGKPSDFTDGYHLNWTAAHRYAAQLAAALDADHDLP